MRTTNIFGVFLVTIAMVHGAPLLSDIPSDISPSLSHHPASEHPPDLDSVARKTPIDLEKDSGDLSHMQLVPRRKKSKSNSHSYRIGTPISSFKSTSNPKKYTSSSKASNINNKATNNKATNNKTTNNKTTNNKTTNKATNKVTQKLNKTKQKATHKINKTKQKVNKANEKVNDKVEKVNNKLDKLKSKLSRPIQASNSTANGLSTEYEDQAGDTEEQDSLDTSTYDTSNSLEDDAEQDSQDLPEDDTEGYTGDDSDMTTMDEDLSGEDSSYTGADSDEADVEDTEGDTGDDSDMTTMDEDVSDEDSSYTGADSDETGVKDTAYNTGEDESDIDAATNFTRKLIRRSQDDGSYGRSTLLFGDDEE